MSEVDLQKEIACRFAQEGYGRLWINDNGFAFHKRGDQYKGFMYGLGKGTSDLIGFTIINDKAIFTALEVKLPRGYATVEQENFITMVNQNGGIAAVVRSWEDVEEVIKKPTN